MPKRKVNWKARAEILASDEHSDAVKRAMMHFWLELDKQEIKKNAEQHKPTSIP